MPPARWIYDHLGFYLPVNRLLPESDPPGVEPGILQTPADLRTRGFFSAQKNLKFIFLSGQDPVILHSKTK